MTDIGLALIDRRTILVVLIVVAAATALLGVPLPLDTTSASSLFVGLAILCGYLYLARTLYRLPVAILGSAWLVARRTIDAYRGEKALSEVGLSTLADDRDTRRLRDAMAEARHGVFAKLKLVVLVFKAGLFFFTYLMTEIPTLTLSFGKWSEQEDKLVDISAPLNPSLPDPEAPRTADRDWFALLRRALGLLDRIGLVIIALLATSPWFYPVTRTLGVMGLIGLVVIYVLRGYFSAVVRESQEREETEIRPIKLDNSHRSPLYVTIV